MKTTINSSKPVLFSEVKMFEQENNKEATTFISENFEEVKRSTLKMGVHEEVVHDLVVDVLVSLYEAEENGKGYDFNYYEKGLTVAEFVYGRIKKYSKNPKYNKDGSEVLGTKLNKDKNKQEPIFAMSASNDTADLDTLTGVQKQYANAQSIDTLDDIDTELSITEQVEYCLSMGIMDGVDVRSLLVNRKQLGQEGVSGSLFEKVRKVVKRNAEFGEALMSILQYSSENSDSFDSILSNF